MNLGFTKRQKIVVASILVTVGLLSTQSVDFNLRFRFIVGLAALAYFLSLWALWEGLNKTKALVLLILPTFFTLAVTSFYFLLPVRWLTRLPVAVAFGILFYMLLLAQNVFNVAAIRTIPLYRAASTASFLFTLLSAFFIFSVVHAFNLLFILNGVVVFLISLPLTLQILWSIDMEERLTLPVIIQSLIISLCIGEMALSLSFWPLVNSMWSLTLSTAMYVLLGLATQVLKGKANAKMVGEYVAIGIGVLLIAFSTTSWTG